MTAGNVKTLYTVGHSNHSLEHFVELLRCHGVAAVADVRSSPYSQRNPHFNQDLLEPSLRGAGIAYLYLGKELGARPEDPHCRPEGRVDFGRLRGTGAFRAGLDRLRVASQRQATAILCAEKDPLNCHRMLLVCRALRTSGLAIQHILEDGRLESHEEAERRLVRRMHVEWTLFEPDVTDADLVERAYDLRSGQIAHGAEAGDEVAAAKDAG
jgi:uncharacterized protein (DUF488 family)